MHWGMLLSHISLFLWAQYAVIENYRPITFGSNDGETEVIDLLEVDIRLSNPQPDEINRVGGS